MKLFGWLVLLFVGSSAVVGEVVPNFSTACPQFFVTFNGIPTPPTVLQGKQYRQICQRQANQNVYEFATLYDTDNRIPVYSAYVYVGRTSCKRKDVWYIEPQLDDQNKGPYMQPDAEKTLPKPPRGTNQALNVDYVKSSYDKGHLYPVFHTNTQSCAESTFTLTNAAPQNPSLNRSKWKKMESDLSKLLNSRCSPNKAYVVTGVVPSTGGQKINGQVNVPSDFWNAYCCLDANNKCNPSGGYLASNQGTNKDISITVAGLEQQLSTLYGTTFLLFGGKS